MDPLVNVRHGYNLWSKVYDHDRNPLIALEDPVVRGALGEIRGQRALDVGCGTGRHSMSLLAAGAEVTAMDFSEGMLAEARRKSDAAQINFIVHDVHHAWPFQSAAFDLVVSGLVLEHIADLEAFFGEIRRVLRPGGRAIVSAMHPAMFLRETQAGFLDPVTGEKVKPGSLPHSVSAFVMAAIRARLEIVELTERAADDEFAASYPRAARYVNWPMLLVLVLRA
jgi:malonyl-CoA O-methyltransferase